jgi:hypothetical protein
MLVVCLHKFFLLIASLYLHYYFNLCGLIEVKSVPGCTVGPFYSPTFRLIEVAKDPPSAPANFGKLLVFYCQMAEQTEYFQEFFRFDLTQYKFFV